MRWQKGNIMLRKVEKLNKEIVNHRNWLLLDSQPVRKEKFKPWEMVTEDKTSTKYITVQYY